LQGSGSAVGQALLEHPAIDFYAFTGSTKVGRRIQQTIGLRRSQLELGSLSSTIVCQDADVDRAATVCMSAAFRKAGQVCTSIQRLYLHSKIADQFADTLVEHVSKQVVGDPRIAETFVGPLITSGEAERVASWIEAAVSSGARALTGGHRVGNCVEPTVLDDVTPQMDVMAKEVFGPVVCLRRYDDESDVIKEVNETPYGLAAGVFTSDIGRAFRFARELRMGSVHVNETSSSRVDLMPYTGVKDSGFGTEGPAYAAREMSEERLITIDHSQGGMP
jgi:succinate-semialdehyde dehydrogenase/glutarate-semialdehyde dehydrogenase